MTLDELAAGEIDCKGGIYKPAKPPKLHNSDPVFTYRGLVNPPPPSQNLKAPHALGGWKQLRKSINHGMPDTLAHSQHVNAATLRTLHRARKVRI